MSTLTARPRATAYAYDAGLMFGRFQLVTLGHLAGVIAMAGTSRLFAVGVGSVNQSRDLRNAWTYEERVEMWRAALPEGLQDRVRFFGQEDLGNPLRWASAVENRMGRLLREEGLDPDRADVALFGHRKDETSFYLDDFPNYILEQLPNVDGINASDLRDEYFRNPDFWLWADTARGRVPDGVIEWLGRFHETPHYARLAEEASRADRQAEPWRRRTSPDGPGLPHDVIFNDAAAVIVQGNRVLMRRRDTFPGKGYWALPEGPIGLREEPVRAAMRIAIERTSIDVSDTVLRKALRDSWTRTDPYRSTKGRTICFPSVFLLTPTPRGRTPEERRRSMALPRVRASDDTGFFTFDEVRKMRSEIHADHAIIIDQALERLGIRIS